MDFKDEVEIDRDPLPGLCYLLDPMGDKTREENKFSGTRARSCWPRSPSDSWWPGTLLEGRSSKGCHARTSCHQAL